MNLKKIFSMMFVVTLTACATQRASPSLIENSTPQEEAQKVIRNYVRTQGESLPPSHSIFKDAGLKDSETLFLSDFNKHLLSLKPDDVSTTKKLARIADLFQDADQDGIHNLEDPDDDNDGYSDGYEGSMDTDPRDGSSNPGSAPFIITVKVDDPASFTIRTNPDLKYNYNVDCKNDGSMEGQRLTRDYTCVFDSPGKYQISIHDNTGTRDGFPQTILSYEIRLVGINQWGTGKWVAFAAAFTNTAVRDNDRGAAWDVPDLSKVADMSSMFYHATTFNQDIGMWDTGNVTDMSYMFSYATAFDQDIGKWDTSKVEDMNGIFYGATAFNHDIGKWNTKNISAPEDMPKLNEKSK